MRTAAYICAIGAGSVRRYRQDILPFAAYDHHSPERITDWMNIRGPAKSFFSSGYYMPGTHQLGNYFGIRQDGRLVAIAGEHMQPQSRPTEDDHFRKLQRQ
jgi:hypothetical protein